jgi:hypothetical protein
MFSLSEESKVPYLEFLSFAIVELTIPLGAHCPHYRHLPRRHTLWLPAFDPLPWLLAQRAQALSHPVSQ